MIRCDVGNHLSKDMHVVYSAVHPLMIQALTLSLGVIIVAESSGRRGGATKALRLDTSPARFWINSSLACRLDTSFLRLWMSASRTSASIADIFRLCLLPPMESKRLRRSQYLPRETSKLDPSIRQLCETMGYLLLFILIFSVIFCKCE